MKFNHLTVLKYSHNDNGHHMWLCLCDCGNTKLVRGTHLEHGESKSCGCLIHAKGRNQTHGLIGTRLYHIWRNMKRRCNDTKGKDFHNYGGRGITYCDEWERFEPFYEWAMSNGYRDNLTIDRINNDKGYSPENCRWATISEQARNRRTCHILTYKGVSKTIREWEEILGMKKGTLENRIVSLHWSIEKAIETPIRKRGI